MTASVSFFRILRTGLLNAWRNRLIATATVATLILTLFVITAVVFLNVITGTLASTIQDKVDISVYFTTDATDAQILALRNQLVSLSYVKSVNFVSQDEALTAFKQRYQNNPVLLQALQELGQNPLSASLNISATDPSKYQDISNYIESSSYKDIISNVNYQQNKTIIQRLSEITKVTKEGSLLVSILFAVIAILVTFNTIRLAMYSLREEIEIMRLVGASSWYIRGPFVVEGVLFGILSAALTMLITYLVVLGTSHYILNFTSSIDLLYYLKTHFWQIFLLQLISGIALGTISSMMAVRRYLNV